MELSKEVLNIIVAVCILAGVGYSFLGFRTFKYLLGLSGFIVGTIIGWFVVYTLTDQMVFASMICMLGGAAGAILMGIFYTIAISILGASLGGLLAAIVLTFSGSGLNLIIIIIAAGVTGVITLFARKLMIIVTSSVVGSWAAVFGIAYYMNGKINPQTHEWIFKPAVKDSGMIIMTWLVFAGLCIFIQYLIAPKEDETKNIREDKKNLLKTKKVKKSSKLKKDQPVDNIVPKNIDEPVKQITKVKRVQSVKSVKHVKRVKPAENVKPAQRSRPTGEAGPAHAERPTRSSRSAQAERPTRSSRPAQAERPTRSSRPDKNERPARISKPVQKVKPDLREKRKKKDDDDWMSKLSSFE
ncbi:MAG: DUF4203 domain-containing protein [Calditrichaeota bacterium]|nr:DUF4203 domain-containing protein [Calditrichota bacterium]